MVWQKPGLQGTPNPASGFTGVKRALRGEASPHPDLSGPGRGVGGFGGGTETLTHPGSVGASSVEASLHLRGLCSLQNSAFAPTCLVLWKIRSRGATLIGPGH